jgi:hypothetical protein
MGFAERSPIVSEAYRRPVVFALLLQFAVATVSLLMLDGGLLASLFGGAVAGFWCGVAIIFCRRPFRPTDSDLIYIRVGTVLAFALASLAALGHFK